MVKTYLNIDLSAVSQKLSSMNSAMNRWPKGNGIVFGNCWKQNTNKAHTFHTFWSMCVRLLTYKIKSQSCKKL